ncbi:MAG: Rrf2 family transcriptional regulator [Candidatus Omnitrophica bacterium]|nr:Rrf2 family transcriptional regulator [Candidatus Omnitrophota bacterium]
MKLSKKGEYALKAMIELARAYKKGPVRISSIAEKEGIPKKFLERILMDLKKVGILKSSRGAGGGYELAKAPKEISFADVIRVTSGPLAPLRCVSKYAHINCPHEKSCGLKKVMQDVRNAVATVLEREKFGK